MRIYKAQNLVDSARATTSPLVDVVLSMGILSFLSAVLVSSNKQYLEELRILLGIDREVQHFGGISDDTFAIYPPYSDDELWRRLKNLPDITFVTDY